MSGASPALTEFQVAAKHAVMLIGESADSSELAMRSNRATRAILETMLDPIRFSASTPSSPGGVYKTRLALRCGRFDLLVDPDLPAGIVLITGSNGGVAKSIFQLEGVGTDHITVTRLLTSTAPS